MATTCMPWSLPLAKRLRLGPMPPLRKCGWYLHARAQDGALSGGVEECAGGGYHRIATAWYPWCGNHLPII